MRLNLLWSLVLLSQMTLLPVKAQTLPSPPRSHFAEVGLSLEAPTGFESATTFHGFQQPETGASIMLNALPIPFSTVISGFTKERLATRQIRLLSTESIEDGSKVLMQLAQEARGQTYLKWLVVLADTQNQTRLVVATFPEEQALILSDSLKQAALSATLLPSTPRAETTLPFQLTPSPKLVAVSGLQGIGKVLAFSKTGVFDPPPPATEPLFLAAPSLGQVPVINRKAFALQRVQAISQLQNTSVTFISPITVAQQSGFEIMATAEDAKTQAPLRVYQTILFLEEGGYVIMLGTVGEAQAEQYLPEFQAMARSYRRNALANRSMPSKSE